MVGTFPVLAQSPVDVAKWDSFKLIEAEPIRFSGPFHCSCMAFYFVHYGGPLKVAFNVSPRSEYEAGRKVVVRFLDANEYYVGWDYFEFPEPTVA